MVAVSGGVDSVVLLHLLHRLPPELRPDLSAAHFHHRLRGKPADVDEKFVKRLCGAWGIPLTVGHAPRWKSRENVEARSRDMRYAFLVRTALRRKTAKIATAHHADDQLETFVMRWLQGAGLKGLSGMRLSRPLKGSSGIELIRPLLQATRKEIEAYAASMKLPFREDATNASDLFLRSRLRRLLRSLQRENPNLAERAATNAVFLQADESALDGQAEALFRKSAVRGAGRVSYPLAVYASSPESHRYRLLQKAAQALLGESYALPAVAVLKVDEILRDSSSGQRYDLPSGLGFEKQRQRFVFFRKSR